jgi:hypothetical protein
MTEKSAPTMPSLVYYQKPCIGNERGVRATPPTQLIFPGGGFGLGIPTKETTSAATPAGERDENFAVLASAPERTLADMSTLRGLQATFLVLAAFNLILTSLMYFDPKRADTSKVTPRASPALDVFQEVPAERRNIEDVDYAFTVIIFILGSASVIWESALGVSAYCLATILNFMLGTSALPYFVYSTRYIFDMFMLYIGLVLRTRLTYTILPLHLRIAPTNIM